MNLERAFQQYVDWMIRQKKSPLYAKSSAETFNTFIREGHSVINDETVEDYLNKQQWKDSTKAKKTAHFRAFESWYTRKPSLCKLKLVEDFTMQQRKPDISIPTIVQQEDLTRFLNTLRSKNVLVWAHAAILKNTGLRFTEAWGLRKSHFEISGASTPTIKFRGKRNSERVVVLNSEALEAFGVWTRQDSFISPAIIRQTWKKVQSELGVSFTPHEVRHTFASVLAAAGFDYGRIADCMGNTVEVCRSRYISYDIQFMKRLVEGV